MRKCNIRDRYPDIIVHRLLQAALLKDGELLAAGGCLEPGDIRSRSNALSGQQERAGVKELGVVAQHCNVMKKEAKSAGEDQGKVYLYVYLQTPKEYDCVIKGIADDHFIVYMPDLGMEATVLKNDFNVAVSSVKPSTVELNAVQVASTALLAPATARLMRGVLQVNTRDGTCVNLGIMQAHTVRAAGSA